MAGSAARVAGNDVKMGEWAAGRKIWTGSGRRSLRRSRSLPCGSWPAVRPMAGRSRILLEVLELGGLCAGQAARALAGTESWSYVGERAGTTRQAAWARWHE